MLGCGTISRPMQIGYARISTEDQTLDLQEDALTKAGCGQIFSDIASGAKTDRPGLAKAIAFARPGDTLVVWRLDRLGRSLQHLIDTVRTLETNQVSFKSLTESMDTTTKWRQAHLPCLRGTRRIRAGPHPTKNTGRTSLS